VPRGPGRFELRQCLVQQPFLRRRIASHRRDLCLPGSLGQSAGSHDNECPTCRDPRMGWSPPDSGSPGGARSARVASLLRGRAQCGSLRRFRGKTQRNPGVGTRCQRGGRRFAAELRSASASRAKPAREPGLVLQETQRPGRSRDRAFLVRVMDGGLLGPLPPPAHPQQRHQAAQPRGQQRLARRSGLFEVR
jgi:hypothetical protein